MTAFQVLFIGLALICALGIVVFLLIVAKYYLTPTVGEFVIDLNPEHEVDALYDIKFSEHPLSFKNRKSVRLTVKCVEKEKS